MKVIFSKYARQEIDDATQYYEIEYQELGKRLRDEVRKAAKRISEYPGAWSVERVEVRTILLLINIPKSGVALEPLHHSTEALFKGICRSPA